MGFADYASSILRENRRLKASIKNRFERKHGSKRVKTIENFSYNNRKDYPEAETRKRKNILIKVFLFLLISIAIGLIIYISNDRYGVYQKSYQNKINQLREDSVDQNLISLYNRNVKSGDNLLVQGEFEDAKFYYQMALSTKPNGKRANFGLTQSLILDCKENGQYCSLAREYYDMLLSNSLLSVEEINKLKLLKGDAVLF